MRIAWIGSAGVVIAAACGRASGSTDWAGTMDTLPNGRVIVTNPAQGIWKRDQGWRIVEVVRIGAADGTGPEVLGQISVIAEDAGRRIWALERDDQTFKVFAPDGRFIRTVGRKGGGPGEMRQVAGVAQTPDGQLVIVDPQGARISVLDTSGTFLRSTPISGGFSIFPWPGGVDTAGYLYNVVPRPEGEAFAFALVRYDSSMTPLDTIIPPRLADPQYFAHRTKDGSVQASVPYSPSLQWRLTRAGDIWFVHTGTYQLFHQNRNGDTVRVVSKPFEQVAVTSEEKDSAVAGLSWFTRQGGTVDRGRIPDLKPAVQGFQISEDGYLWVNPVRADTALARRTYEIFDPEGRFLGEVRLPFALSSYPTPVLRRDRIIGITHDLDGVPYIVRARIER